jgi:hypothetical protein
MTEQTIDSYFSKVNELQVLTSNYNTTVEQILTLFAQLDTINNTLNTEFDEMLNMPSTVQHLRKMILVEIERNDKSFSQTYLLNFYNTKFNYFNTFRIGKTHTEEEQYLKEVANIKLEIDNIMNTCDCMKNRKFLIKNLY